MARTPPNDQNLSAPKPLSRGERCDMIEITTEMSRSSKQSLKHPGYARFRPAPPNTGKQSEARVRTELWAGNPGFQWLWLNSFMGHDPTDISYLLTYSLSSPGSISRSHGSSRHRARRSWCHSPVLRGCTLGGTRGTQARTH